MQSRKMAQMNLPGKAERQTERTDECRPRGEAAEWDDLRAWGGCISTNDTVSNIDK